jgi:serine-type D-Ala-D-Ala carboxypeptidase (penicillin-binding protein 5/6)
MVNIVKYLSVLLLIANTSFAFETAAEQAILLDLETGTVLFEKNADKLMSPSSMSKLMTSYIVFKALKEGQIKLDSEFTISKKAWQTGGSKTFLDVDAKVKVEDLLRGMVVQSGNDATIALAEGISGDESTFAEKMNKNASMLGLKNSTFRNSTGLPDPEHLMTSKDLALLAKAIITEFPEYYTYFAETEYTYNNITQPNRNSLLGEMGVDGMKTGFTDAGGYGLVSSAKQNDRRLIAVVNGLSNDKERIEETRKLLNYGFMNFESLKLFSANKEFGKVKVWYGTESSLPIRLANDVTILKSSKDNKDVNVTIKYNEPLIAPIKKGDKIAQMTIALSETNKQHIDILAEEDVEKASWLRKIFQNAKIKMAEQVSKYLG